MRAAGLSASGPGCRARSASCSAQRRVWVACSASPASVAAAPVPSTVAAVKTDGQVLPRGAAGSWDEAAVGSPVVRCYVGDNEQRWYMWYSGRGASSHAVDLAAASSGSIGVAVSSDGMNWVRGAEQISGMRGAEADSDVGSMLMPSFDSGDWWTFDTCHVAPSDVQVLSNGNVSSGVGVYWMFYTGGDFTPVPVPAGFPGGPHAAGATLEGMRMRPGLAMSQDGRNWARIEADHHTGALFDVGEPGEFDELLIASPQVLAVAPRDMRMYYVTWEPRLGRYVAAMAVSPDGFRWTKRGVVFDPAASASASASGPAAAFDALGPAAISVVRDVDNRQYVMMYEAVAADNTRCVGMAVSKDGVAWQRCPQPVLAPALVAAGEAGEGEGDAWDGGAVGAPCAVSMSGGRWRLYYGGRQAAGAGPWEGIGVALSVEGSATFQGMPMQYRRRAAAAAGL